MENKKGTATNRKGLGSTYAGTQSPDGHQPDAYQTPSAKQQKQGGAHKQEQQPVKGQQPLGSEYNERDSYGDSDQPGAKTDGKSKDGAAEGTPIRRGKVDRR